MARLEQLGAIELLEGYEARQFTPVEVVRALAARIEAADAELRAFVTTTLDEAEAEAAAAETRWHRREARPLEGVPFAVKDLFDTAGVRTTYGSPIFARHVPTSDADAVALARAAGAILLGKTSTHEFAWGITGYNAHFGTGRNPWNLERVSGGSSSGSGAALAAEFVPLALGSDTGGSVRTPAAFCGVVGLKPSYGRISTRGVFPLAPSLDHVGPMARTPRDARLFLQALSSPLVTNERELRGLRVDVSGALLPVEPAPEVEGALAHVVDVLLDAGCAAVDAGFDGAASIRPVFATLQAAEAVRGHRTAGIWPQRRDEYGPDVGGRLADAESVSFDAYLEAAAAREGIRARFDRFFERADLVVTPVSPAAPVVWGSDELDHLGQRREFRDLVLPLTTPQNVAGLPACTVRAGFHDDGLPIGLQITGARGAEAAVLAAAEAFAAATPDLQARRPAL